MTCFTCDTGSLNIAAPDPSKRVNYTLGMVLGVDDFRQEQEYHLDRVRWLARDLLGYGTVRGLSVCLEEDGANGWRVRVTKGAAISPSGRLICVPFDQCCNLNDWLTAQAREKKKKEELEKHLYSPPSGPLALYVVLSYKECLTDNAPIPGEPCRSEEELMQPSRIKDGFCLELRYEAPPQREEDADRDFAAWLLAIPIEETSPPSISEGSFLELLRDAANPWIDSPAISSPPSDFMFGSPPADLTINRELLRAALRLWVTELRPKWIASYGCAAAPPAPKATDDAVLLAEITVPLLDITGGWIVSDVEDPEKNEERRPFVIYLRLLQELLKPAVEGVTAPALVPGDAVIAEQSFGASSKPGVSAAYSRADHTHGTPALPHLDGDVTGSVPNSKISKIQGIGIVAAGAASGQVLTYSGSIWMPASLPAVPPVTLSGDIIGPAADTSVARLQKIAVKADQPTDGQILTYVKALNVWQAKDPQAGVGQFVERRLPQKYEIVAAGGFRIEGGRRTIKSVVATAVYNKLKFEKSSGAAFPYLLYFSFDKYDPRGSYIVKLTPGWILDSSEGTTLQEFSVYFAGYQESGFMVRLQNENKEGSMAALGAIELYIEVSRYEPDRG